MTNQQHPTTPPPELVKQWRAAASNVPASLSTDPGGRHDYIDYIATQAARWGADQELDACCDWVSQWRCMVGGNRPEVGLRAARRPKPPSLKEQALDALGREEADSCSPHNLAIIRRALEQLDD
jgi:hypothetical protein